jgi:diadenosine tetraphosphate (Ap4A) HIT family hydrolase
MNNFDLHSDFQSKKIIKKLSVSTVVLNNTKEIDWYIVVYKALDKKNIFELKSSERKEFFQDIELVGGLVKEIYAPDQMNVAMFGNITPQLHCHIMPRFKNDFAWPNPVFCTQVTKTDNISDLAGMLIERI